MRYLRYLALLAVLALPAAYSQAQVAVGVGVGPGYGYGAAPVCSYGYYDYYPYACAPYGYYGPEWFNGGVFIGAGRWHHGPAFYGHVNRGFDPRFGYHGAYPARGEHFDNHHDFHDFHSTHTMDHAGHYRSEPHGR